MAIFDSIQPLRFMPESYLPSSPYIPTHFVAQKVSLDGSSFDFELDELGQTSIIRMVVDDEILVPYVDLSKYDAESKDWFWYQTETNFPYRYYKTTLSLGNIYPSNYSGLELASIPEFNKDTTRVEAEFTNYDGSLITFYKYSPLIVTVNNRAYTDLSDYSKFQPIDRLNKVNTTIPEFYYDFDSRIYTNQNLAGIDPSQIKIHYFVVSDNSVSVKCRMSSNIGTETFYTPRVNHFIVKLKGQSLRV